MAQVPEVAAKRALVLDANILLRGVLGTRVRALIERYADRLSLVTTQSCVEDTRKYCRIFAVGVFGTGVATWSTRNVEIYLGEL